MISDVAFGQYYPVKSVIHRLDPRTKILILVAYIVMIFVITSFWGFLLAGAFLLVAILLSKVPVLSVLKSVRAILFIIILTFIINLFLHEDSNATTLVSWWIFTITDKSLFYAIFMALRLSFLVFGSSLLTLTTTPVSLTDGIESLLSPLKIVHFPVHELALIMSIALRFIPTLIEETERIIDAQKARGADFDTGGLIAKAKALLPILVPLIISAFRRAEELGDAMDARCYNGSKNRTKYKKLSFVLRDFISLFVTALVFAGVILLNIYVGGL